MKSSMALGCLWVAFLALNLNTAKAAPGQTTNAILAASDADANAALAETCHALKYDSYFVAQNVKDNLKRLNPEVTHPNFAKHFLLLKTELVMENLYLIADCKTGEFFHAKVSGDGAKFTVSSAKVEMTDKKSGVITVYEWDGKSWIRGETIDPSEYAAKPVDLAYGTVGAAAAGLPAPAQKNSQGTATPSAAASVGPSTSPSAAKVSGTTPVIVVTPTPTLVNQYDAVFAKYPAPVSDQTCAPLQYSTFFRAQNNQKSIIKLNPDLTHANFAGTKLLVRTEAIFESITLIADCASGKFSSEFLTGDLTYHANSRMVMIKSSSAKPTLMLWSDSQFVEIPNPVLNHTATITNTLYGEKAALLVKVLPNPQHNDMIRFEKLKRTAELAPVFEDLGSDEIESGTCRVPHGKSPECDVDVK